MKGIYLTTALLVASICSNSDAAVLCTAKAGDVTLRVREACEKDEIQVDPATLHLPGANFFTVYDAKGTKVGTAIQHDMLRATVPFRVGTTPVTLIVSRNGLQQSGGSEPGTYWDSPDCSGQPFIGYESFYPGEEALMTLTSVSGPGWTVYAAETTKNRRMLVQSQRLSGGNCTKVERMMEVFPAKALMDLQTLFTPPFSLR